jgi:hypothetical protein
MSQAAARAGREIVGDATVHFNRLFATYADIVADRRARGKAGDATVSHVRAS